MTTEVKTNNEFAKWLGEWITGIQHSNMSVEDKQPEKSSCTDAQNDSADADPSDLVNE